jgi:hypothetical protein
MADHAPGEHTGLTQQFERLDTSTSAALNPNAPRESPTFPGNFPVADMDISLGDSDVSTRLDLLASGEKYSHPDAASTTRARRPYTRVDSEIEFRMREPSFLYDGRSAANAARGEHRRSISPVTTRPVSHTNNDLT